MADFVKLDDHELDEVSGGVKYNIGNTPVSVHNAPGGGVIYTLFKGDYLVTDGQSYWVGGINWCHVYTAFGEGYINGACL